MTKLKLLWLRYWAPSSKFWRKIGDAAILFIPVLATMSFINPRWEDYRSMVYVCLIVFKFITNFSLQSDVKNNAVK